MYAIINLLKKKKKEIDNPKYSFKSQKLVHLMVYKIRKTMLNHLRIINRMIFQLLHWSTVISEK